MNFNTPANLLKPLGEDALMRGYRARRAAVPHATLEALTPGASTAGQHHQKLRRAAEKLVAQTFFGTLLKQMHQSPFRSEIFDGGRGGQAYSALYDQVLSDRMAHSGTAQKLVSSIVRRNERASAYAKHAKGLNAAAIGGKAKANDGSASHDDGGHDNPRDVSSPPRHPENANPFKDVRIHVAPELRA